MNRNHQTPPTRNHSPSFFWTIYVDEVRCKRGVVSCGYSVEESERHAMDQLGREGLDTSYSVIKTLACNLDCKQDRTRFAKEVRGWYKQHGMDSSTATEGAKQAVKTAMGMLAHLRKRGEFN
jgi:hypothetical protein